MHYVLNVNEYKRYLFSQGLLNKELAKEINISENHLSCIVNHKVNPSAKIARKIAKALNVKIDDIFDYVALEA